MERKDIRPEWTRQDGFGANNRSETEQSNVPGKPDSSNEDKPAKADEDDGA